MNENEFNTLLFFLSSDKESEVAESIDFLKETGDKRAVIPLIELLNTSNSFVVKHKAAKALYHLKDERALAPLMKATISPVNKGYNGTFVYACSAFDCTEHLSFFIDLIIEDGYFVALTVQLVLDEMRGPFKREILLSCIDKLEKALNEDLDTIQFIEETLDFLEEKLNELNN